MLQNACLLAKIGADTAENEQHFAESLPTTGNDVDPWLIAGTPAQKAKLAQRCCEQSPVLAAPTWGLDASVRH